MKRKPTVRATGDLDYGVLANSMGFLLRRAQLAVLGDLADRLVPLRLRPAQFTTLSLIDSNPDMAQSQLGALLDIRRPNFVALLDELEVRGLAKRCSQSHDRRIKTLALTPLGRRVLKRAAAVHAEHEKQLLRCVGADGRRAFEDALSGLLNLSD